MALLVGCIAPSKTSIPERHADLKPLTQGDKVHWQLGCMNNPGIDFVIDADGYAVLPLLGKVRLEGMTLDQAKHTIISTYENRRLFEHLHESDITLRRF